MAELIVGKFYRVPVSHGIWNGIGGDWVVLGPWHEDKAVIGFEKEHYHLDPRFFPQRLMKEQPFGGRIYPIEIFAVSLSEASLVPYGGQAIVPTQPVLRLRKCVRAMPPHPRHAATWLPKLTEAHADKRLGPNMTCPHKGVSLSAMPVEFGCVTCPLHGLRFNVKTGECVA